MKHYCLIGVGGWAHDSSLEEVNDAPTKIFGFFTQKKLLNKVINDFPVELRERGRFNYLVVEEVKVNKLEPKKKALQYYKLDGKFKAVKPPKWAKESFLADLTEWT